MEKYLKEEYNVYESEYLTKEEEIEEYFENNGSDFFECGQGFYQDEAEFICKVGDKFYNVEIRAEVLSEKQNVGDRLYWVDNITSVEYEEIPKPQPKERINVTYTLELTRDQKIALEHFFKKNNIDYQSSLY
jgi:hypothetical protein